MRLAHEKTTFDQVGRFDEKYWPTKISEKYSLSAICIANYAMSLFYFSPMSAVILAIFLAVVLALMLAVMSSMMTVYMSAIMLAIMSALM